MDAVDVDPPHVDLLRPALRAKVEKRDKMRTVGQDVLEMRVEVAIALARDQVGETEDRVGPGVIAAQRVVARLVPHEVVGEPLAANGGGS